MAEKRIRKELEDLNENPPSGFVSCAGDPENPFECQVIVKGPPGTPHEGSELALTVKFPGAYPFKPLRVQLAEAIDHPAVLPDGTIAIQMMEMNGWSPTFVLSKVLETILWTLGPKMPPKEGDVYTFINGSSEIMGQIIEVEVRLAPTDTVAEITEKVALKYVSEHQWSEDRSYHRWRLLMLLEEGGRVEEVGAQPLKRLCDLGSNIPTSGHRFIPKASTMPLG
mmetsp:Transcript_58834/g.117725  ORF Transcript_58834/g.117725 Transcript_58834/m.117725 type:complete len:224 (+) Transcript_58834:93-764(+)